MTEGFLKESPQDSVTGWPWGHLKEGGEGGAAGTGRGRTELGIWTLPWLGVELGQVPGVGVGGPAAASLTRRSVLSDPVCRP